MATFLTLSDDPIGVICGFLGLDKSVDLMTCSRWLSLTIERILLGRPIELRSVDYRAFQRNVPNPTGLFTKMVFEGKSFLVGEDNRVDWETMEPTGRVKNIIRQADSDAPYSNVKLLLNKPVDECKNYSEEEFCRCAVAVKISFVARTNPCEYDKVLSFANPVNIEVIVTERQAPRANDLIKSMTAFSRLKSFEFNNLGPEHTDAYFALFAEVLKHVKTLKRFPHLGTDTILRLVDYTNKNPDYVNVFPLTRVHSLNSLFDGHFAHELVRAFPSLKYGFSSVVFLPTKERSLHYMMHATSPKLHVKCMTVREHRELAYVMYRAFSERLCFSLKTLEFDHGSNWGSAYNIISFLMALFGEKLSSCKDEIKQSRDRWIERCEHIASTRSGPLLVSIYRGCTSDDEAFYKNEFFMFLKALPWIKFEFTRSSHFYR